MGAAMREHPILFSALMVQAILDGRKTQTRRTIKPQPLARTGRKFIVPDDAPKKWRDCDDFISVCPYGLKCENLWVRETWALKSGYGWVYKADNSKFNDGLKWKPSIHITRDASRIDLKITDIHVERLNDISEKDAIAEGIELPHPGETLYHGWARDKYAELWVEINGEESWAANPWVWVIEFERIRP